MALLRPLTPLALGAMISACAQADPSGSPLAEAWLSGRSVVVTMDVVPNNTSETYSDFAHYLNEFATSVDDSWAFFNQDSRSTRNRLPITIDVEVPAYSVLFMKKGKAKGYLYPGPIVEPQVYNFVQRTFEGRDIPGYLYQFKPDEVSIEATQNGEKFNIKRTRP
ncbi:hypothetical protein C7H09_15730 [Marinobacter fuscus]|uniref:Uncharacterized protein n=1 Tax=Marinobacter fuscus TaxID=2109942 RepID=A0A2T1K4P5_9GAMM|nr:hypothetical protein [Marinobacter fuscus]NWO04699.1 hypothetical protein [Alteromonadaceae bacterium]PSF05055.1 hypothetical protein C7H09_15730 [Marinobacter fuscus]